MHNGVFVGRDAEKQQTKILILGESHHWSSGDWIIGEGETEAQTEERRKRKAESYKTEDVVKRYLANYVERSRRDKAYRFFDYIVRAFGIDPELHREDFWSKVYFGNYVEKLCGVRDSQAKKAIEEESEQYNQSLFRFIKNHGIDYVFCFSRRVYSALPQLEKQDGENEIDGVDAHRLEKRIYYPVLRENIDIAFDKPVTFYGLRHTSQGFSYRKYQERIAKIIQKHDLPF